MYVKHDFCTIKGLHVRSCAFICLVLVSAMAWVRTWSSIVLVVYVVLLQLDTYDTEASSDIQAGAERQPVQGDSMSVTEHVATA